MNDRGTSELVLPRCFEAAVRQYPERVAVVDGDSYTSYAALQERARALAAVLRRRGLGHGDRTAVLAERGARIGVDEAGSPDGAPGSRLRLAQG